MSGTLVMSALLCAAAGSFSDDAPALPQTARGTLSLELNARSAPMPEIELASGAALLLSGDRAQGATSELDAPVDEVRLRRLRRWERALKWSTAGSLVVTSTLGTMVAVNQPTAFGDGRCQTGNPILGTYGCDRGLSTLHGSSGILSAILYTSDGVLALAIPGPVGNVSKEARPWHRALTYVHLGGMALQPVLGLVSAFPQVIGVRGTAPGDRFPRNTRTIHVGLGYLTTAAYLATLALER